MPTIFAVFSVVVCVCLDAVDELRQALRRCLTINITRRRLWLNSISPSNTYLFILGVRSVGWLAVWLRLMVGLCVAGSVVSVERTLIAVRLLRKSIIKCGDEYD